MHNTFVCELSFQLESRGILFEVDWVPRELKQEADAITNSDCSCLNNEHSLDATLDKLPFRVVRELLAWGEGFYDASELTNIWRQ